ncbi:MAG: Histone acetyltransferase HPA2 and related acetyltransferases, partial [uncultured Thermomicrobiales bacterium]
GPDRARHSPEPSGSGGPPPPALRPRGLVAGAVGRGDRGRPRRCRRGRRVAWGGPCRLRPAGHRRPVPRLRRRRGRPRVVPAAGAGNRDRAGTAGCGRGYRPDDAVLRAGSRAALRRPGVPGDLPGRAPPGV